MENDYSFKTTPFGYDKEAVLDALNRLVDENRNLAQTVEAQKRTIDALNQTHMDIDTQIRDLTTQIHQLTDDNRILEYRLFQLNGKYEELQSHSDLFAKVLIDARAKAESIKESALIEANDQKLADEKALYDRIRIEDASVDQKLLNYYKAKHNLLLIQEALMRLSTQTNNALDELNRLMENENIIES